MDNRARQDPFSISGYLKKDLESGNLQSEIFDLERIPGAVRVSKIFAEENGRTFGILQHEAGHTTDSEYSQTDCNSLVDDHEIPNLGQDMYKMYLDGYVTSAATINYVHNVHSELFTARFGESFFANGTNKNLELDAEQTQRFIQSVYCNSEIRHWAAPIDFGTLERDLCIECIDAEQIRTSSIVLSARSEYFRTMLSGRWRECSDNKVTLENGQYSKSTVIFHYGMTISVCIASW